MQICIILPFDIIQEKRNFLPFVALSRHYHITGFSGKKLFSQLSYALISSPYQDGCIFRICLQRGMDGKPHHFQQIVSAVST